MKTWRCAVLALAVAAAALVISCSARVKHLEVDSSFTPERLQQNDLAILGATSIAGPDTDDITLSRNLSTHVENTVREHRPDIKIMRWGEVRRTLDDRTLEPLLASIREYGSFEDSDLDTLSALLGDHARYIFVHRIETDELSFSESDVTEQQGDETVKTGTRLATKRMISSTLSIYDLTDRKRVWYATIEGDVETSRKIPVEEGVDIGGFLGSVINFAEAVDDIFGTPESPKYPQPALQTSVLDKIYEKFAKELPTKDE